MRWYSKFIGHRDSDGLFHQAYCDVWICAPWTGADMDDDFAAFSGGGEPYPHP